MSSASSPATTTRAQRRHLETVEEVKEIARERLGQDGPSGLSLRAIARDMGVVPSALYRYFPSHAHLLDAIADDAASSLIDHVQAAVKSVPCTDCLGRWLAGLRAYRTWALEHASGYSLNFGELAGEQSGSDDPDTIVCRLVDILARVAADAQRAGELDEARTGISEVVSAAVPDLKSEDGPPPHIRASALAAWSAVHGTVALEVSSRLPDLGIASDTYFEAQLMGIARAMGFHVDK